MGAFPESPLSPSSEPEPDLLVCPEDVDWIFDVDTLRSAGGSILIKKNGLEEPPRDSPHHPFTLSPSSATIWDQTVRRLSMAAGELHLVITAYSNAEAQEVVFYSRVAGFREDGMPRIVATFQPINQSSYQSVADNVQQNWLYLLHEIKNPLSILKASDDLEYQERLDANVEHSRAAQTRRFAINCLEDHLRNGVFLATEDSQMIPNRPEPIDLKLFMEDIKESFEVLLRIENNELKLNLDIDAYQIARIDRALLAQLLNNLLLNKINLLKNETVTLDCSLATSKTDGSGTLLVITIEDKGPAFPEHILQGIDSDPNLEGLLRIQRNSGLGLPICRRIVSVMGGEIKFYNDPPKTRTRIWIPLG